MTDNEQSKRWGVYLQSMEDRNGRYCVFKTPDGREVNVTITSDDKDFSFYVKLKEKAKQQKQPFEPFEITELVRVVQLPMPRPQRQDIGCSDIAKKVFDNKREEFEAEMKRMDK